MATGVAVEVAVPVWVPVAVAVELESEWSEFWLTTAATSLVQRHYNESLAAPFRCRWKTFGLLFSIVQCAVVGRVPLGAHRWVADR